MKVLVLSQWYPPEPMKLLSDMTESLQREGHDVEVLTGFPNWPEGRLYPGYDLRLYQREVIGGVRVTRVPLYPNHGYSATGRALNLTSFVLAASTLGSLLMQRPDVIHAIQPPTTALAAWFLSRIWRVPFTCEVQDMWPETLAATGIMSGPRKLRIVGAYCDWVYRKAAAIRVISEGFQRNLVNKGVPPETIHAIPNWVDTEFYGPRPRNTELAARLGLTGGFNIMYAGTMGLAQGLSTVVEAAGLLRDLPEVRFVFVGDGLDTSRLQRLAEERSLDTVKFVGRQPGELMPELYALADVLLVHLKDDPLFRITIPHKTMTYMAAGKPVVAAVQGDVAALIKGAQAGMTCAASDPSALADTVRMMFGLTSQERARMGANGRAEACRRFSRDTLVRRLATMFEDVVAGRDRLGAGA
jgi:putative colanic acid biosynthesis glycosyltransferase WcaI